MYPFSGKVAVGVVGVLALASCGASAAPRSSQATIPTPSAQIITPAASPTPRVAPAAKGRFPAGYANAFEDFLVAYARADEKGDPDYPELKRFSTREALTWVRSNIAAHARLRVAHNGSWRFRDLGAEKVTATAAYVGQCMDWSTWPVQNRSTHATFQRFAAWSQLVYANVQKTDGQWRVTTISVQATSC